MDTVCCRVLKNVWACRKVCHQICQTCRCSILGGASNVYYEYAQEANHHSHAPPLPPRPLHLNCPWSSSLWGASTHTRSPLVGQSGNAASCRLISAAPRTHLRHTLLLNGAWQTLEHVCQQGAWPKGVGGVQKGNLLNICLTLFYAYFFFRF